MTIEPMSVEEIRRLVTKINWQFADHIGTESHERAGLILAWIHAEARARTLEHWHDKHPLLEVCEICAWGVDEHIDAVKKEVGWPEGE